MVNQNQSKGCCGVSPKTLQDWITVFLSTWITPMSLSRNWPWINETTLPMFMILSGTGCTQWLVSEGYPCFPPFFSRRRYLKNDPSFRTLCGVIWGYLITSLFTFLCYTILHPLFQPKCSWDDFAISPWDPNLPSLKKCLLSKYSVGNCDHWYQAPRRGNLK